MNLGDGPCGLRLMLGLGSVRAQDLKGSEAMAEVGMGGSCVLTCFFMQCVFVFVCFVRKDHFIDYFFFFFPRKHIGFNEVFTGKQFLWSRSKPSISE